MKFSDERLQAILDRAKERGQRRRTEDAVASLLSGIAMHVILFVALVIPLYLLFYTNTGNEDEEQIREVQITVQKLQVTPSSSASNRPEPPEQQPVQPQMLVEPPIVAWQSSVSVPVANLDENLDVQDLLTEPSNPADTIGGFAALIDEAQPYDGALALPSFGAQIAIILDVSGSMEENSRGVRRYLLSNFPKTTVYECIGCSFTDDSYPTQLIQHLCARLPVEAIYFVCDLEDEVTKEGIDMISESLKSNRVALHMRSFGNVPDLQFIQAIHGSGGDIALLKE